MQSRGRVSERYIFVKEMPLRIGDLRGISPGTLMRTPEFEILQLSQDGRSLSLIPRVRGDDLGTLSKAISKVVVNEPFRDTLYQRGPDGELEMVAHIVYGDGYGDYVRRSETPPRAPANGANRPSRHAALSEMDLLRMNRDLRSLTRDDKLVLYRSESA